MPHHDGDLRRNRSGEDKGLTICVHRHDLVRSHALNEEIKKKDGLLQSRQVEDSRSLTARRWVTK